MSSDPRCPACGGPVGTTATYCMRCDAEFEQPVGAESEGTAMGNAARNGNSERFPEAIATIEGLDFLDRWLAPDGWLDDSLTVVVGVVAGVVVGFLTLLVGGVLAGGTVGGLGGLVAWIGATSYLARRRTIFGAVHGACYAVAGLLVLVPLIAFTDATTGGTVAGRVILFVVGELVFGLVAAFLFGVGYVAGKRRPDSDV